MKITKRQLRRLIHESVFAEYQQDVRGGDPGPNIAMINVRRMTQEYAYERPYMGMRRKDRLQRPSHGGEYYDFEIKGFKVIDSTHGDIGTINGILDSKVNPLIEIQNGDIEIVIPKMDQYIDEIDWDNNTLYISAPDGLIDMYLGSDEEE